jgi:hypothetical protein
MNKIQWNSVESRFFVPFFLFLAGESNNWRWWWWFNRVHHHIIFVGWKKGEKVLSMMRWWGDIRLALMGLGPLHYIQLQEETAE